MSLSPKYILTAFAVFVFLQGLGTSFLSSEILGLFGLPQDSLTILLVQLLGALQLGWGILNYLCRNHKFGGIFGRPLLLSNLAILFASGISMIRVLLKAPFGPFYPILILPSLYWVFAFLIFKVFRTD